MALSFTIEELAVALGVEDDGEAWRTRPVDESKLGLLLAELLGCDPEHRTLLLVRACSSYSSDIQLIDPRSSSEQTNFAQLHLPALRRRQIDFDIFQILQMTSESPVWARYLRGHPGEAQRVCEAVITTTAPLVRLFTQALIDMHVNPSVRGFVCR